MKQKWPHLVKLSILLIQVVESQKDDQKSLDINDFFDFGDNTSATSDVAVGARKFNVDEKIVELDLEKLDFARFQKKMEVFKGQYLTPYLNQSRKQLTYQGDRSNKNKYELRDASERFLKVRVADVMLQAIYMSRHHLKECEGYSSFGTRDASFRIAFLYTKIRKTYKMIVKYTKRTYNTPRHHDKPLHYLIMHAKILRHHVDFRYFFYTMMKIHDKYEEKYGLTKPPGTIDSNVKIKYLSQEEVKEE